MKRDTLLYILSLAWIAVLRGGIRYTMRLMPSFFTSS